MGHADNVGSLESNQKLSSQRVTSVINKLASKYGVDRSRLPPIGVGLAARVASNEDDQGRAKNRRAELVRS